MIAETLKNRFQGPAGIIWLVCEEEAVIMEHTNTKENRESIGFPIWGKRFCWDGIVLGSWSWTVITLGPAWLSSIKAGRLRSEHQRSCCLVWEWFNYKLVPFVSDIWYWKSKTSMDQTVLKLINSLVWPYVSTGAELSGHFQLLELSSRLAWGIVGLTAVQSKQTVQMRGKKI